MDNLPSYLSNHGLFSDYYLTRRLAETLPLAPDDPRDHDTAAQVADSRSHQVAALWAANRPSMGANEASVEPFVHGVLRLLGFGLALQAPIKRPSQNPMKADVALFVDQAAADRFNANSRADNHDRYSPAFSVVEVEHLGANLDTRLSDNSNPSYQIVNYLTYTELPFGILTDGARWRIYRRSDPPRTDVYFEVNLEQIMATPDPHARAAAFQWFYAFFNQRAFDRFDRASFLNTVLRGGQQHAVGLQAGLRRQAFDVVEELARGIHVADPALPPPVVYERATIILYRLLFIKFAEDLDILPLSDPNYQRLYGFSKLQNELLTALDDPALNLGADAASTRYWRLLLDFFSALNDGVPKPGGWLIYQYNGGLFKPERIGNAAVPDRYLARAIDRLARLDGVRVDYQELNVRHLGSIYEGLLEQQLASDAAGGLRLVNAAGEGRGERHDSGSYYTPDYIVEYMVAATLDPLCIGKSAAEIDGLRLLDPAMGSGHFLAAALLRLAGWHARAAKFEQSKARPYFPGETADDRPTRMEDVAVADDEVLHSAQLLVERCIYGVDLNPLAVELAKLSLWIITLGSNKALSFLDHHLKIGNSLLGINDLQAMGMLPLAATASAKEKAAYRKRAAAAAAGQIPTFETVFNQQLTVLLGYLEAIRQMPSDTAAEVHAKEAAYADFEQQVDRYRTVADAWVAVYYGSTASNDQFSTAAEHLADAGWPTASAALATAHTIGRARRFFHWRLEFPDVFYRNGSGSSSPLEGGLGGGFDAVIGNPPYVKQGLLTGDKPAFERLYPATYNSIADLYVYFFERGLGLLRERGRLAYIASNKFMRAGYGAKLRGLLTGSTAIERIVDFSALPVFPDATTDPAIYLLRGGPPADGHTVEVSTMPRLPSTADELAVLAEAAANVLPQAGAAFDAAGWSLGSVGVTDLLAKLEASGVPLGQYVNSSIRRGLLTGFNEAFVIDEATRARLIAEDAASAEIIKPFVVGDDVRRYTPLPVGKHVIFTRRGVDISRYPAIERYLRQFYDDLLPKKQSSDLRGRKPGPYHWYELQDNVAYFADFEQPKIIYPVIGQDRRFTIDTDGYYSNDKAFIIPRDDKYLLAVLNSKLIWFYLKPICSPLGNIAHGGRLELRKSYMERVPIATPAAAVAAQLAGLAEQQLRLERDRQAEIAAFLSDRSRQLGVDLSTLSGKDTFRTFYAGDFARFEAALLRNRAVLKRAGLNLALDRDRRNLEANFNHALAAIQPLAAQLAANDRQIDQLVYSLYALTAAEIALVES